MNRAYDNCLNSPEQRLTCILRGLPLFVKAKRAPTTVFSKKILAGTNARQRQHGEGSKIVDAGKSLQKANPVLGPFRYSIDRMRPVQA
jgi:hypothetical protein